LFNIGLLHFKQDQFDKAEETFKKVISDFPEATIAEFENSVEHGMTTAKALLGLINCSLAMGDEVSAWDSLDKLNEFENSSFVMFTDPSGVTFKKTYRMLGQELLDQYAATKQELE
ncbi:MAG: tetratricopeptide repeat protein, partial [Spirochaetes bacterium]|nr:tetratricopeptide repeat protein [Spirochaetota bacterium]